MTEDDGVTGVPGVTEVAAVTDGRGTAGHRGVTGHGLGRGLRWDRLPQLLVLVLLRAYQLVISPQEGQTCRFYPSCSTYAVTAVRRHGALRGSLLAARRVGRCHPWNPGGVDDVPQVGESPRWLSRPWLTGGRARDPAARHTG